MYEWLTTEFNIFGFYLFRGIRTNVADGTFFTWFFLLIISVFLTKVAWKTGFLQFSYKVLKWVIRTTIKLVKLAWSIIVLAYSLVLLYIECKKLEVNMFNYFQNRTIDGFGVIFTHRDGSENIGIPHPKYVLKTFVLLKSVKFKIKNVFYKAFSLIR